MSFIARPGLLRCVGTAPLRTAPRAVASRLPALRRGVQTNPITEKQQYELLNQQRMARPNSPHLEIYQPQLTWYLSGLHRITGVAVGGLFYVGAIAYCLHPLYPAIDSTHLITLVHDLPTWAKIAGKTLLAFPLSFHSYNGLRHLLWDTGKGLSMKGVYASGYAVLAASVATTLYLVFGI